MAQRISFEMPIKSANQNPQYILQNPVGMIQNLNGPKNAQFGFDVFIFGL
jgi:hypothetical protein